MSTTNQTADAIRLREGTPNAERPVAVQSRTLIGLDNSVVIDAELLRTGDAAHVASVKALLNAGRSAIITATTVLTAADSGKTFYLNNATGFVTTLPAPALDLNFTFVNTLANTSGNHTVVTNASANVIKGNQNSVAGDAGDSGTADDTINFVANASLAGDKVTVHSDGTSWFAYAISRVAAGVTFTQAS